MINKEVAELRRRFNPDRSTVSRIYGCYVNTNGEIITKFTESLDGMALDAKEKYLTLLKKALGGSMGKTLNDIEFTPRQVMESDEHKLLMELRRTKLNDPEALDRFYGKVALSLDLDVNYLILMAYDCYDVPYRSSDGVLQSEAGDTQHSYFVCSVCPVKDTVSVLHYDTAAAAFRDRGADQVVYAPELGFTFPAFDDRATNIYSVLYYSRSAKTGYDTFVNNIFGKKPIMPVNVQRDAFKGVLSETMGVCSAELVQDIQTGLHGIVTEHKEAKLPETLTMTAKQVKQLVTSCGMDAGLADNLELRFNEVFGEGSEIPPQNLINDKTLEFRNDNVVVRVNPDRPDLIRTLNKGGRQFLIIDVSEGVELNGIPVTVNTDKKAEFSEELLVRS